MLYFFEIVRYTSTMKETKHKSDSYLREDFRLFHIASPLDREIDFHYHDFHKVFIFIKGKGEYWIEEKKYDLLPGDVILIPGGTLHRPVIAPGTSYERIIMYISSDFFQGEMTDSFECFRQAQKEGRHLLRVGNPETTRFKSIVDEIVNDKDSRDEFGAKVIERIRFQEFLILLNRALKNREVSYSTDPVSNPTIRDIKAYIEEHITDNIRIDDIARVLYLNRSYIMHLFKQETGTTIGNYITEKRLFLAARYIKEGHPKGEASLMSGFPNYSAYHYALKKSGVGKGYDVE